MYKNEKCITTGGRNQKVFIISSLVFFIFMISVSFFRDKGYVKVLDAYKTIERLEESIRIVSFENRRLEQEIHSLRENSNAYVEKIAREELGLVKSNEIIFEFIGKNKFNKG